MKIKQSTTLSYILMFFLGILNYYFILTPNFDYLGYTLDEFEVIKLIIASIILLLIVVLYSKLNDVFYKIVFTSYWILFYSGQLIYYIFTEFFLMVNILTLLPFLFLFLADRFLNGKTIKVKKLAMRDRNTYIFIFAIATVSIIPFLKYYNTINLKNLIFQDIYETRLLIRGIDRGILGYIINPLARVVLPFLVIFTYNNKKKISFFLSVLYIVLLYLLNGSLKSLFIGLLAVLFFYKGDYREKEKRILDLINLSLVASFIEYAIFKKYLITDYLRRILYVPARLFQMYAEHFQNNYTFFSHTKLYQTFGYSEYSGSFTRYAGEVLFNKPGANANVGIFVEGYVSLGSLGIIIMSILFIMFIVFIRRLNLAEQYYGILFVFLYVINTSFLESLLVTHGLLLYMFIAIFLIPSKSNGTDFKSYSRIP